jgi:hypothetical protein
VSDLRVVVDGVAVASDEARRFWERYSRWMEEHPSDLAGFARTEGFASVRPELHEGGPALVVSRTAPQIPYGPAAKKTARRNGRGKRRKGPRGTT